MKSSYQARELSSRKSAKKQVVSVNSQPHKDPPQIENGVMVYRSMSALFDTWLNSIPRGLNPRANVEIGMALTLSVGDWWHVAQAASQENTSIRDFLERVIASEAVDYVNGDRPPLSWGGILFSRSDIEADKVFNAFVDSHDLRGRFKEKTIAELFCEWRYRADSNEQERADFMRRYFDGDPKYEAIREFLNTPDPERVTRTVFLPTGLREACEKKAASKGQSLEEYLISLAEKDILKKG